MKEKRHYRTFAYFYKYAGEHSCRKYLDIKLDGLDQAHPDLIMLMTVPGDCENEENIWEKDVEILPDAMVLRIQTFMSRHNLSWVRVLTLSDQQGKWDEEFFKSFEASGDRTFPPHSIFHPSRADELAEHAGKGVPFLFAGKENAKNRIVADAAMEQMREKGFKIIPKNERKARRKKRPKNPPASWIDRADEDYTLFVGDKGALHSGAQPDNPGTDKPDARDMVIQITDAFEAFDTQKTKHLLITSAKEAGRWDLFAALLGKKKLKPFTGTKHYDYIFTDHVFDPQELDALLRRHDGKRIIIDAADQPEILSKKSVIQVLEEATRSAEQHDPEDKKTSSLPAIDPTFLFAGQIIILMSNSKKQLSGNKRFTKLLRHFTVI